MSDDLKPLLDALRCGSSAAFQQVYFAEKNRLFGLLLRLAGDAHVASDLFQNVWLKLARHAPRLHDDTNLRAWLHTVARHEYISYRRAQIVDLSRFLAWGRHVESTARSVAPTSEAYELEAALEALNDSDREVLLLAGVAGLDGPEAATALGISEAAYRQRLARARQRLTAELERTHTRSDTPPCSSSHPVPRKARS